MGDTLWLTRAVMETWAVLEDPGCEGGAVLNVLYTIIISSKNSNFVFGFVNGSLWLKYTIL